MKASIYITLLLLGSTCFAQQGDFVGDPDETFMTARELAFNDHRKQAQDSLRLLLQKYPDYHDIRLFLANTYSWDGVYDKARTEYSHLLRKGYNELQVWQAAIKNELYADEPFNALKMTEDALRQFPNDPNILYLKASAEDKANEQEGALSTLDSLLKKYPMHGQASSLQANIMGKLRKHTIGLKSTLDIYSQTFAPMQYYLVRYGRQTKYGSFKAKLNVSHRFRRTGAQFEVDMYPRITKGLYAYLNFGLANTSLYPDIRYGAEIYKSLPKKLEGSLGFRSIQYSTATIIYTGSIGWYTGNDYLAFRTYITPGDSGTSTSGTVLYRKYRSDANNYFNIDMGMGFSPEIYRFNFEGNGNTIIQLKSQKLNLGYYFTSKNKKTAWGIKTGVTHQEIVFNPGSYYWIYSIGLSWDLNF